jgi:protein O-mannosyl-transferase
MAMLSASRHDGWGRSSVGRATGSQSVGQGFESPRLHHLMESGLASEQNQPRNMALEPQTHTPDPGGRGKVAGVCFLLVVAVLLVFGQTLRYEFINYGDDRYVTKNPEVAGGLTLDGIRWAFNYSHPINLHPLTWLSHMFDCQLYGPNAGGHHLTSVLLHAAVAVLLFLILRRMTAALWPSAFAAAVFAIHPLRVESVAWIGERKDVLGGLFFVLTLWAYVGYAKKSEVRGQKPEVRPLSSGRYLLALGLFVLGLMSDPILVTLPFVLLLLDYWPLRRVSNLRFLVSRSSTFPDLLSTASRLVREKIPFFALSAALCAMAALGRREAFTVTAAFPLQLRIANALVSYVNYLSQMFYPAGLAVYYPRPSIGWPEAEVTLALMILATITVVAFSLRSKQPYLLVGWLWYLGMLVPVIGIVQAGDQAYADRFTYLPQIGLYLAVAWAAMDFADSVRFRRWVPWAGAISVISVLMVCAWVQTSFWRNSELLWKHALACTSRNYVAHNNLGAVCLEQNRSAEAKQHFEKVIEIKPDLAEAQNYLGALLAGEGRFAEAIEHFQKVLQIDQRNGDAAYNLGNVLLAQGRSDEAIEQFQKTIAIQPRHADAHYNLGVLLGAQGRFAEAIEHIQKAIEINPAASDAEFGLARVYAAQGRLTEAIEHCDKALRIRPDDIEGHYRFALLLQSNGKYEGAIAHYQAVLELEPRHLPACNNLAWLLATCPDASARNGSRAVGLAQQAEQLSGGRQPQILDTLAAAYAEAGRFPEAVETAKRAVDLAATGNYGALADAIRSHLRLYEAGSAFRETP